MELFQIDDDGRLFMSAAIHQWNVLAARGVDVVIDLEGGLDLCIPTQANHCLYVYFPFDDDDRAAAEPDEAARDRAARRRRSCAKATRVLSHCTGGFNRSGLVAGLILTELGMSGAEALARIRAKRPGALYNGTFADYLASVGASRPSG